MPFLDKKALRQPSQKYWLKDLTLHFSLWVLDTPHMTLLWKYFQNRIRVISEKCGINLRTWHVAPYLSLSPLQLQFSNFSTPSAITWTVADRSVAWVLLLNKEAWSHLFLTWVRLKPMSIKSYRRCAKSLAIQQKVAIFSDFIMAAETFFRKKSREISFVFCRLCCQNMFTWAESFKKHFNQVLFSV